MTDSSIRAPRQREADRQRELRRLEEQRQAPRRQLPDKPAGDNTTARLAALEHKWAALERAANRAAREQQQRAAWERRAALIREMEELITPRPAQPMRPVEPTAWLGNPHFDASLMTAPLRWW
jgi:hypothetical protein